MGTPGSGWANTVIGIYVSQNSRISKGCIRFLLWCLCCSTPALAQQSVNQRSFFVSSSEISGAIVKIGATTKGRLPTLEGFVHQPDQPIERYTKGYFECTFQLLPPVDGSTTVRVVAKEFFPQPISESRSQSRRAFCPADASPPNRRSDDPLSAPCGC